MIIWKKKSKWDSFLLVIFLPCTKKNWCCAKETFLYIAFYLLNTRVVYGNTGYITTEIFLKFSLFLKYEWIRKSWENSKEWDDFEIYFYLLLPYFLHTLLNTHPPFVFCAKKMFLTYKYYRFFGYPNLLHLT